MSLLYTFTSTFPTVPSRSTMFMLEAMTYKVTIATIANVLNDAAPIVQVWTNQYTSRNSDGVWHALDLKLLDVVCNGDKIYSTYGLSVVITSCTDFSFTFRVKASKDDVAWSWYGRYERDGYVKVESPRNGDMWTQKPDYTLIVNRLYCGNFLSAVDAKSFGFTHVLNVADNLDMIYSPSDTIVYHKIPMRDGAHHSLLLEHVRNAVEWIKLNDVGNNQILVHCRAGIGRAGSIAIAYVFMLNKQWTFDECLKFITDKRFVYPHKSLAKQLESLYR